MWLFTNERHGPCNEFSGGGEPENLLTNLCLRHLTTFLLTTLRVFRVREEIKLSSKSLLLCNGPHLNKKLYSIQMLPHCPMFHGKLKSFTHIPLYPSRKVHN
jgi:hypothetical protein